MAAFEGRRKETTLYLWTSFTVLYLTSFQLEMIHCWPEGPFLSRALRSIPSPGYQTFAPLQLNVPVYGPEVPYLGMLSEPLKIGSVIRIQGYVPPNTREFQFNLCNDCSDGPIHLHIGIRFHEEVVVRNSYEGEQWKTEERYGGIPFSVNQEFILLIEVRAEDYRITVNGNEAWTFEHRVPYSTVVEFEIKGQPIKVWKIDYTDVAHQQETQSLQVNGDISKNPSAMFEKFTLNLRCECTPQSSADSDQPIP